MRTVSYIALLALAQASSTPEDPRLNEFSGNLGDAFKKAQAQRAEEAKTEAVDSIRNLLAKSEEIEAIVVANLRNARRLEKQYQAELADLKRVIQYAKETNNFVPWLKKLGITCYDLGIDATEYNRLATVPQAWVSAVDAPTRT